MLRRHQIGLVEYNEIGTQKLVFVDFLDRIVMFERRVLRALAADSIRIVREPSRGNGRAVDHGDNAVDGDARGDLRPVEGLHQWFGKGQARRLDDDVLRRSRVVEETSECRNEIIRHRAADATVGQLDDALFRTALDAAASENLAVDADVAEFVDDHR